MRVTLHIGATFDQFLTLETVGRHLCARNRRGIGNPVDKHINRVAATHFCGQGQVADDDVLFLLHIVIIIETIRVAPLAVVAVFLVIVGVAVPIGSLKCLVFRHCAAHFIRCKSVVGGTEIEAQLVHRTRFHFDIVGKHNREGLPLVGVWVVDGQTHLFLQPTRLAHSVSFVQFVVLQEGKDVVVEDTHNPQSHRVKADGIEIDGSFVHIGNDDTIVSPTHLREVVGQVETILIIALQEHTVGGTNTTAHGQLKAFQLVRIKVGLIEIEIHLISLNVSLIANFLVEIHEAVKVLVFLQRLREKQSSLASRLVDIEHHGLEDILSINGQAAFHLGLAVIGLSIENDGHLIFVFLALKALQLKLKEVVAQRSRLHGMCLAESVIKDFDGILKVDGRGKGNLHEITHLFVGGANGLHRDEAEILSAHAKAKLKLLVSRHIHEVGHLELADIVLVLVDVVVLETDGVLVNPNGLAFQSGLEVESLGGDGFAVLHFQRRGIVEPHHDRLARRNDARRVTVEHGQHSLIQRLDALHEHFRTFSRSLLAARGHEDQQQRHDNQADAAEFSQFLICTHIVKL